MSSKLLKMLGVLFALCLFASACGGDDDSASDDTATTDAATESDSAGDEEEAMEEDDHAEGEDVGGGVDEDAAAEAMEEAAEEEIVEETSTSSIAELEEQWAERRAEIVQGIVDAGYGVDENNVLTGPGGFTIDLNNCPSDWDATEGIADGEVLIGHTIPQSGNLAAYGNIATGMGVYFDYLNENGGIGPDGLKINYIVKDDEYVATKTQEFIDELLQSDKPFYITTLGSPNTFSVYDKLNAECVPQPMVQTGHQAWGDPEGHPWTTGLQLSYASEALLWGSWVEQNLADQAPVKVVGLVMDNDFGLAYEQGFERYAEASDIIEFEAIRHDPAAPTLTNEITTVAAENPDVFIVMSAGNPCPLAITEAARAGITETAAAVWTPSVCKAVSSYVAPAGEAAEGWRVIGGGFKDNTDPQYADDPYIAWMNELLDSSGGDSNNSLQGSGVGQYGWPHAQALMIAAELPGGLTRPNLILAVRSLDMAHPGVLDGISFAASGNDDAYLIEGSEISRFDAAGQTWIQEGGIIDLNGQSSNCAWVAGEGC